MEVSALSIWVPWSALAGSLVCLAGVVGVLIRSPWRALAVRVADLERAFPAWQASMSALATSATDAYAQAHEERVRAQTQRAGAASGAARRAREEPAPPPATAREARDRAKAEIAARFTNGGAPR